MAVKVISVLLAASIIIPFGVYFLGRKTRKRGKAMLITNIASFFTTLGVSTFVLFANGAAAAEEAAASAGAVSVGSGLLYCRPRWSQGFLPSARALPLPRQAPPHWAQSAKIRN